MAAKKRGGSKGSRRKSKPSKDQTVESSTGGAKQYRLPEASKIEHHLANAEAWEKKLTDLKAHVKKAYEAAAVDGVSKTLIGELRAIKAGDPIIARQKLEAFGIGLKVVGAPFQLNVFDTMYENDVAQARAEAAVAARTGRSPECRFAEGSPAADAYAETYMEVQAGMVPGADKLTPDEIKAAIAKKPIGEVQTTH